MTNNIGGIHGYGYGINNLYNGRQNKELQQPEENVKPNEQPQQQTVNVDPNEVLNFLASSSVKIANTPAVVPGNDAATAERVDGFVQNFEMIYSIIAQEFGNKIADKLLNDDEFIDAIMAQAQA